MGCGNSKKATGAAGAAGAAPEKSPDGFPLLNYQDVRKNITSGDVCVMHRPGDNVAPHVGILLHLPDSDVVLLWKSRTKPTPLDAVTGTKRASAVTASTKLFDGSYERVIIHHTDTDGFDMEAMREVIAEMEEAGFSEEEQQALGERLAEAATGSKDDVSSWLCALVAAETLSRAGVPLEGAPLDLATAPSAFPPKPVTLKETVELVMPQIKRGNAGSPPLLARLVDGIVGNSEDDYDAVPWESVVDTFQTGDLVLFSGATSSGALIKAAEMSEFSHVGLFVRLPEFDTLLLWEASTNKAGIVDLDTGVVNQGVEMLPAKTKIFSGWYDKVAVRRLVDVDEDQRNDMMAKLLKFREEVKGRPYEQSKLEMIRSSLEILGSNDAEDLSSFFCSEFVAEVYQRMGLLGTEKNSNEYNPDDFSTKCDFQPLFGHLEDELYIEMKL